MWVEKIKSLRFFILIEFYVMINTSKSSYMAKVMLLCFCMVIALPIFTSSVLMVGNAVAQDQGAAAAGTDVTGTDDTKLTEVMCNVLDIVTGTAGKTFAAFAVVSVGIGFFTGKVSWGLMVGVAAGIAAIFGAASIVSALSGEGEADCDTI